MFIIFQIILIFLIFPLNFIFPWLEFKVTFPWHWKDFSSLLPNETPTLGKSCINPLTPKISLIILSTVCHTVLVMLVLVWRIWHWINLSNNHLIDIFLYSHHICWVWYWHCEEELSFGHCLNWIKVMHQSIQGFIPLTSSNPQASDSPPSPKVKNLNLERLG